MESVIKDKAQSARAGTGLALLLAAGTLCSKETLSNEPLLRVA